MEGGGKGKVWRTRLRLQRWQNEEFKKLRVLSMSEGRWAMNVTASL